MMTHAVDARILAGAKRLRRDLHAHPEPANEEKETAHRVAAFLRGHGVTSIQRGVGGHGLIARVPGTHDGPAILLRADLDALPIHERTSLPYRSRRMGVHHACGHDGHMASLAAALASLAHDHGARPPVYGLFQPAEETGEGAGRVLAHLHRMRISLGRVFAIHNKPGLPLGTVGVRMGTAAKASMGVRVRMVGRRGHASEPQLARNPIPVVAALARAIQPGPVSGRADRAAFATIVGINSGPENFGVSPGTAALALTLRGTTQAALDRLRARLRARVRREASAAGLKSSWEEVDVFRETRNAARAVREVRAAAAVAGLRLRELPEPLSASEDFGRLTERWPGALVLLGSGVDHAPLHSAGYDFPEALVEPTVRLWMGLAGTVGRNSP